MLNTIETNTMKFKLQFIQFGFALPPTCTMYTSKIKQIQYDLSHMYTEFVSSDDSQTLFIMACDVIFATTGQYYIIENIQELDLAMKKACTYIQSY